MKGRTVAVVGGAGLLALGIWLGSFFKGFGLGDGRGSGIVGNPSVSVTGEKTNLTRPASQSQAASPPAGTGDDDSNVVHVLVQGEGVKLKTDNGEDWRDSDLKEIVDLANKAPGDEHGVRVRIQLHQTATNGAKSDLFEALQIAGIDRDAIHELPGFVQ